MFDVSRCSGRFDFDADNTRWCEHKDTCALPELRVLGQGKVPDYRGIAVHMAMDECTQRIEVGSMKNTIEILERMNEWRRYDG